MTYASFFDGKSLVNMNPDDFREFRKHNWKNNINNPEAFNKFFGFEQSPYKQNTRADDLEHQSNHLFKFDIEKDFIP